MLTETTFTPWASLGGGILIGISAVMVMGLFGKIAGIAGITQGALALPGAARDRDWRIAFVLGLMAAPLAILALGGAVVQTVPANLGLMIAAGLLVGTGTALGSGCTSGHGVCGISRLSLRGIVATVFYVLAGGLVMAVARHVLGVL